MSSNRESVREILAGAEGPLDTTEVRARVAQLGPGAKSDSIKRVLREMAAEGAVVEGENRRQRLPGSRCSGTPMRRDKAVTVPVMSNLVSTVVVIGFTSPVIEAAR